MDFCSCDLRLRRSTGNGVCSALGRIGILGGALDNNLPIGRAIDPAFLAAEITEIVERLMETYRDYRIENEHFINTARIGLKPF